METNATRVVIEADTKVVQTLHELLKRVPLKGEEVPDFVLVLNTINSAMDKAGYIDSLLSDKNKK